MSDNEAYVILALILFVYKVVMRYLDIRQEKIRALCAYATKSQPEFIFPAMKKLSKEEQERMMKRFNSGNVFNIDEAREKSKLKRPSNHIPED